MLEKEQAWENEKIQIADNAAKNSTVVVDLKAQLEKLQKENSEMTEVLKN